MGRLALPLAATLALSICSCDTVPPAHTGGPLPPSPMICNAEPASWAIGKEATAEMVERVRVDTHSRIARVLRPGQMVTMEFSAERVNVRVNERDAIIGISCG